MSGGARPVNKPRVVQPGARPKSLHSHMDTHARKIYQTAVESNAHSMYVGVTTNEKTGERQWHVYASNNWREAVCHCSELWEKLDMLADVDDAPVDQEQPYEGCLPAKGTPRSFTARTNDTQTQREWPRVDSFWQGTAPPKRPPTAAPPKAKRQVRDEEAPFHSTWADEHPHAGWGDSERPPLEAALASIALPY